MTNRSAPSLVDGFGRTHRDLRVSLTDRCNLRCSYCMPPDFADWLPGPELLTTDELIAIVEAAVSLGVDEVRLTGGEPLLRADVVDVVRRLAQIEPAPALSLTTNGLRLPRLAQQLADAGLRRVNISLDTLWPERFAALTHRDRFHDVLAGIEAAQRAGLHPVKINTVLTRGVNDDEAIELVRWSMRQGLSLRFIEQMPLDAQGAWDRTTMITAADVKDLLSAAFSLTPVPRGSAPAEEFLIDGGPATVGIIASVTQPFCSACDRLRLTADGQLRNCLFAHQEDDLRSVLRDAALTPDQAREEVLRRLRRVVRDKRAGHGIDDPMFIQPARPMSAIGG